MGKFVGIWIDNREATIVCLDEGQERHETRKSHAICHIRLHGETGLLSLPREIAPRGNEDVNVYFRNVLESTSEAKAIYIFGPGMAKDILKRAMMQAGELGARIVGVEPAGHLTEIQIIAKVKEHFFPSKTAEQGI